MSLKYPPSTSIRASHRAALTHPDPRVPPEVLSDTTDGALPAAGAGDLASDLSFVPPDRIEDPGRLRSDGLGGLGGRGVGRDACKTHG